MKSRITIEVDFDNSNQPIIQILYKESDDVRDSLIKSFLQSFGGQSSWCRIMWVQSNDVHGGGEQFSRIQISPVRESDLKEQSALMTTYAKEK